MKGSGFSFKFASKQNIRFEKLNGTKDLSHTKPPGWLRYQNATINLKKTLMIDVSRRLFYFHSTIKK